MWTQGLGWDGVCVVVVKIKMDLKFNVHVWLICFCPGPKAHPSRCSCISLYVLCCSCQLFTCFTMDSYRFLWIPLDSFGLVHVWFNIHKNTSACFAAIFNLLRWRGEVGRTGKVDLDTTQGNNQVRIHLLPAASARHKETCKCISTACSKRKA